MMRMEEDCGCAPLQCCLLLRGSPGSCLQPHMSRACSELHCRSGLLATGFLYSQVAEEEREWVCVCVYWERIGVIHCLGPVLSGVHRHSSETEACLTSVGRNVGDVFALYFIVPSVKGERWMVRALSVRWGMWRLSIKSTMSVGW